jgi:hypothetical protein
VTTEGGLAHRCSDNAARAHDILRSKAKTQYKSEKAFDPPVTLEIDGTSNAATVAENKPHLLQN